MNSLLTTDQIARYLQLKPVTVRRKAARGELPAIKIGKQLRFDQQQIDRWLGHVGRPIHVLVVDDEKMVGDMIKDILINRGCQVSVALSSVEALGLITGNRYDLVLLDLVMPEMNGCELFRHIREVDKHVPVAIVTAYPEGDLMRKAMELGPFLIIKKPFTVEDIIYAVCSFTRSLPGNGL